MRLAPSPRAHGGDAPRGTLDFSAPLNPLGPPAWLLEALTSALGGLAAYPRPSYERLREALAGLHPGLDPGMLVPLNGAAEALQLALLALAPRRLLVVEPTFGDNALQAGAAGVDYEPVLMRRGPQGWSLDPEALCMRPRERLTGALVLLSNPNNPTGHHAPPEELEALAGCLWERGAWLLVDEAFLRLSQRPHWSMASRAPPNTIVVGSLTKDLALPGLRLGYLVAHDRRVAATLDSARQPWNVNTLAAAAGEALAENRRLLAAHLEAARRLIAAEAPRILGGLRALGLTAWWGGPPFILVHHPSKPHPHLNRALHARGFHVRDASSFHGLGPEYSRISIRLPGENAALLEALAASLD
ncbi:MAG: histidinol-phosphate aminotransferase family protein [Desulfurococcales archaeon]|nr:histidinol-phosphate aminotransferase family protein [Desulfurococcales archaeon]